MKEVIPRNRALIFSTSTPQIGHRGLLTTLFLNKFSLVGDKLLQAFHINTFTTCGTFKDHNYFPNVLYSETLEHSPKFCRRSFLSIWYALFTEKIPCDEPPQINFFVCPRELRGKLHIFFPTSSALKISVTRGTFHHLCLHQ